jgi:hypothetical protein
MAKMPEIAELSQTAQLLYTELLQNVLIGSLPSSKGISFSRKLKKNSASWYVQVVIGEQRRQYYLGKDNDETQLFIEKFKKQISDEKTSKENRAQLVSALRHSGALVPDNKSARVIELMETSGIFIKNGVLVGSHAFMTYGNMLGYRWLSQLFRTQDIDIAKSLSSVDKINIALPRKIDIPKILLSSDYPFFEVPTLNHKHPSTSFKIRGKELMVDVLTPMLGKESNAPIFIEEFNCSAEPLRYLDYLIQDPVQAVIPYRQGILVNVPEPSRYALHKLVISQRRPVAFALKAKKDIQQAQQLLKILINESEYELSNAYAEAKLYGKTFASLIDKALNKLDSEIKSDFIAVCS